MTRAQDLAAQIVTLGQALQAELTSGPMATASTAAELVTALAKGGPIRLTPGSYLGNFRITMPTTLLGTPDCLLTPLDRLAPTLSIQQVSDVTVSGITIQNGAPDRECVVVGDVAATDAATQPVTVVLKNVTVQAGPTGGHRGIALHGTNLTVRACRVTGFWEAGRDSQAIWIQNGPGPYTIEDNHLEASGETILVGGDSIKIPTCVPSDITIRNNTCVKPEAWRTNRSTVKNAIELKIGRRVLIEGNVIDGNWRSGQDGTPIVVTTRNQYGDTPWAVIESVIIRGNTTSRCADGNAISLLGQDDNFPSQQMRDVTIEGNLFRDSPGGIKIGNGVLGSLIIRHNTLPAITGNFLQFYTSPSMRAITVTLLAFTDNVLRQGAYGISGDGTGGGLPTLTAYTMLLAFTGNVIEKHAERTISLPAGNAWVPVGGLAALLDPKTLKLLSGTAGY